MDLHILKLQEECKKCLRLRENGGNCEGKSSGSPCVVFNEVES